jgi:hypothetical protein
MPAQPPYAAKVPLSPVSRSRTRSGSPSGSTRLRLIFTELDPGLVSPQAPAQFQRRGDEPAHVRLGEIATISGWDVPDGFGVSSSTEHQPSTAARLLPLAVSADLPFTLASARAKIPGVALRWLSICHAEMVRPWHGWPTGTAVLQTGPSELRSSNPARPRQVRKGIFPTADDSAARRESHRQATTIHGRGCS